MTEVHVVFPPKGQPIVVYETQACIRGQHVVWRIRSENKDVKQVRLEFKNKKDTFFNDTTAFVKVMAPYSRRSPHRSLQMVWGMAPDLPRNEPRRISKYTVYGRDSKGKDVVKPLDPMILITRDP